MTDDLGRKLEEGLGHGPTGAPPNLVDVVERGRRIKRRRAAVNGVGVLTAVAVGWAAIAMPWSTGNDPIVVGPGPSPSACDKSQADPRSCPRDDPDRQHGFADLQPGWNRLTAPPEPRTEGAVVWAPGVQLIMWGGYSAGDGQVHADGFLWDSSTGDWARMPPSPMLARAGAGAVVAREQVIFFGGYGSDSEPMNDGAIFDTETDAWRAAPLAPIASVPLAAVWTGDEAIFWGSKQRDDKLVEGAAFDPATETWRALPNAPLAINEGHGIWTGEELIVFGAELDGNNRSQTAHAKGMAYSPAADSWRLLPDVELSAQASAIAWTGTGLLAWDYELRAALYEPSTDRWRDLERVPLEFSECYPESAFVGRYVFAWFCGEAALWDSQTETWTQIDTPRQMVPGEPVIAGEVLLFAGATHESEDNSLWAYVPPAFVE